MQEIIKNLRKGKRVNVSEIARELDLPISTVSDRIKKIEKKYVIKRSSLLDFEKLGYKVHAFIAVKAKKGFLKFLDYKFVNSFYQVNTGYDYMMEVVCRNLSEFKHIVSLVRKESEEYKVFQIIKTIEKEKFLGGNENES